MKFWKLARWLALLPVALMLQAGAAHAYANTPPIDPSYNSRIIDDGLFLNSGTMSTADVQNFLNAKVPTCDTNHPGGDPNQPPPYVCLKSYVDPQHGSAAQIIHDTAVSVGLNPQVILVTLEKEEGLVTDTWPYPSQYKTAMGYGCPESQSVCDSQYFGFYNQVTLGAKLLRAGAARDCGDTTTLPGWTVNSQWRLGNTVAVDGRPTYLSTCATGSLYNYTPHRPDSAYTPVNGVYYYGNYNFINYFTSWFGPTTFLLEKTAGSPQIYLTFGNENGEQKLLIPNSDVMVAWGLQTKPVSIVDPSYLSAFTDDGTLTTLAKSDDGNPAIFMVDGGHKFQLTGPQQCTDWGFSCFDTSAVKTMPPYFVTSLAGTNSLASMFANNGEVYKPEAGKKRPVLDLQTLNQLGGWSYVQPVQNTNAAQAMGMLYLTNDTVLQFSGNNNIFLFDQTLHKFPGPGVFAAWNGGGKPLETAPAGSDGGLPSGGDMAPIAVDGGGTKWLLDQGRRLSLAGQEANWPVNTAVSFGQGALGRMPAATLKPVLHDAATGNFFTVGGGNKYVFATMDDLLGVGATMNSVTDVSGLTEGMQAYGGMNLAPGRIYQVSGSSALYMNNVSSSLQIPSPAYFAYFDLPYNKTITVDATTAARYPSSMMQIAFKDGGGSLYVAGGARHPLPSATASAAGVDPSSLPVVSDWALARMAVGSQVTQFVKGSDGAIYYLNGGQKHYIGSQAKLQALGGQASVVSEPDEFLGLLATGPAA